MSKQVSAFGATSDPRPRPTDAVRSAKPITLLESAVESSIATEPGGVHTPKMTMKNAALLALVGTVLMTALLFWIFISNLLNVLRDVTAPVVLFSSFIYAFGCLTLAIFFFVFYKAQS
jgi:hypothetical protein